MKSMTAFARAETVSPEGRVTLEIRSVNSRYLDLHMRVPEDFRVLEPVWRELLQKRLSRGKVDISLRYQLETVVSEQIQINDGVLDSLVQACHQVEEKMNNPARMSAVDLLRWHGVVQDSGADMNALIGSAKNIMNEALDEFIANREREGSAIKGMIEQRLSGIETLVKQVQERRPHVVAALRERMHGKLEELPAKVDEQRLEQELVLYVQKLDVDEELDRLNAHVTEMRSVLNRKEPIGRRLDFLMQEFNREANTLSSKSSDVETTQAAVDMKVLIEQMREQIQNIE